MTTSADAQWSAFSDGDIRRRWARARTAMAEQGLDALVNQRRGELPVLHRSTGTLAYHYSCTRPAVLVFPREGEPAVVAARC